MNTSWAVNSWATNSWAADTWAALGDVMETLALGDLTTAVANWLASFADITFLDRNTEVRDRLVANYSETSLDATTLFSRFLQNRA